MMRQQRSQTLESGVDALHAPPLVAVGDLAANLALLGRGGLPGTASVHAGEESKIGHRGYFEGRNVCWDSFCINQW